MMGVKEAKQPIEQLPDTLRELSEAIGMDATLRLVEAYSGTLLTARHKFPDDHQVVELIGREAADKLSFHFCGQQLLIPRAKKYFEQLRNQRIIADRKAGMRLQQIALKYDLSQRRILDILRGVVVLEKRIKNRNRRIIADRMAGKSAEQLAQQYGLSTKRVKAILLELRQETDAPPAPSHPAPDPELQELERLRQETSAIQAQIRLPAGEVARGRLEELRSILASAAGAIGLG